MQIKVLVENGVYFILASELINNGLHVSDRFTSEREQLRRTALRVKPTFPFNANLACFKSNIHAPNFMVFFNVLIARKRGQRNPRVTRKGWRLVSNGLLLTTNRYHARHL